MRILFLAPEPFFENRGTPIAIFNLVQVLAQIGHQVDLVTYHLGEEINISGVAVKRILKIPFIRKIPIGPSLRKIFLDFFLFFKALKLCLGKKYDIIHGVEEGAYLGAFLSRIFKIPLVYDMDSNVLDQLKYSKVFGRPFLAFFARWLEKFSIKGAQIIISVCSDLTQRVQKEFPDKKIFQIEDLPLFENMASSPAEVENLKKSLGLTNESMVLYTGNFENYQGIELLIEAAGQVLKVKKEVKFVLAGGEKKQIAKMKNLAAKLGLKNHIIFAGKVPLFQIPLYLEAASVLVSPRIKGTNVPMKIYSYLFSRVPMVATDIISHTQILNREVAVLVKPDKNALAAGILKLLEDPGLARKIGDAARNLAESAYSRPIYEQKVVAAFLYLEKNLKKVPEKL